MKCEQCHTKFNKHDQQGGYVNNKWFCDVHIQSQPERSKREDSIETCVFCGTPHTEYPREHCDFC